MAFNGSGTFERLYNWVTDLGNSVNITASRMDGEMDGMATGLSNCITKDGQTTITANIPMNSKKLTGLTNGSARTDSIALGQVQDGTYTTLGTAGGSADTYTATPSPAITAYATGSRFNIKINADNTGASTLNISAVGAKNMKKYDGAGAKVDVESGDLQQDQYYDLLYDGTDVVVLNPQKPYIDALNFSDPSFNRNYVTNGQASVSTRGTTFDSTTTPANNDDTILFDGIRLLSDGNDIADVSQETTTVPTGAYSAIKFDQETANKQWACLHVLSAADSAAMIGSTASLSFSARKGGSNATLETLRAAVISWTGTADSVTTDVVATWNGAGTDPSLATNWTYENTPSDLTLTTSYQTFSIANVSIDTSSTANVAVLIWLDDTDATVADTAFITNIKLEKGTSVTAFDPRLFNEERSAVGIGLVQTDSSLSSTYTNTSTAIPFDNTIPQNTEGAEFTTLAFTPKYATSTLKITINAVLAANGTQQMAIALFKDSDADAIAASASHDDTGGRNRVLTAIYFESSGSTSSRTYKLRYGSSAGSCYINGNTSTAYFGGALKSGIIIEEIL